MPPEIVPVTEELRNSTPPCVLSLVKAAAADVRDAAAVEFDILPVKVPPLAFSVPFTVTVEVNVDATSPSLVQSMVVLL